MRDENSCNGCALADRRSFLRDLSRSAIGALMALGASPVYARAASVGFIEAIGGSAGASGSGIERRYPIPAADGVSIDRSQGVMIARYAGAVYAMSLACPHQNTALEWKADDHEFRCPKHHSEFRPDGTLVEGRAKRSIDRFVVRRDGPDIMVDVDRLYRQDEDPGPWAAAVVKLQDGA